MFFAISICRNLRGTKNGFLTAFLTAFLTVRKNPASFLPLAALLLRLRCPDALRRLTAPSGYVIPAVYLQLLLSSPYSHFFLFYFISPFSIPFLFFCISLSVHFSFLFLFMRIFMCTYRLAFGTQRHQLPLTLFPCICLFVYSFFLLLCCICLVVYFFIPGYPCMHILFFMYTLAYIFNFTKCICLPDVVYFFYVYLYVYILLLEVYIQGCVFIYKNAYLKRMYKKEKCIHYVAHFFFAGCCRQDA